MHLSISNVILVASLLVATSSANVRMGRIDISHPDDDSNSSLDAVHGSRPCGGPGYVIAFRVEGCTSDSICRVQAENTPRSELEFIPSQNISEIGVRFKLLVDGEFKTVYEKLLPNSDVEAGERYIVNSKGASDKDLKGRIVTVQYILYRAADNTVEVCTETDFEVY